MQHLSSQRSIFSFFRCEMFDQNGHGGRSRTRTDHKAQDALFEFDRNPAYARQCFVVDHAPSRLNQERSRQIDYAVTTERFPDLRLSRDFKVRPAIASPPHGRQTQYAAGFGDQGVGVEGLGHIQIGAHFLAQLAIELLPLGGEQDDVDMAQP
jgi:hypothetical protein